MKLYLKYTLIYLVLFYAESALAQKKASNRNSTPKKKVTKFIEPTPVPPDELKETFRQQAHAFVWQFQKDTNLPASILFKEAVEIEEDTVTFKRFYTKKAIHFSVNSHGYNDDVPDNINFYVQTIRAHYKIRYSILSIWNAVKNSYEAYEVFNDPYMMGLAKLVCLKSGRIYIREDSYYIRGEKSD